ncbi:TerD family protein [Metabacillus idriensis]|uniref:TerD domain-containing protein n=1 Tax=Metabacillus idriensis TaxID=324768 RepID=A0A6I2M8Y4_9BACI|nr:TerD family protein [Metabacillus idriensis]MCM3595756.1 TerD family protein [Metabacillus idriensis]MRX53867.1 hypothetical protein [Metabacillus idriensis]
MTRNYRFPVSITFSDEPAIVVGKLYEHSGQWKFNSVELGYFEGLVALFQDFTVKIEAETSAQQISPSSLK